MKKPNRHACVIALLLLTCGCVLLDTAATTGSDGMQATTGPGGLVHGAYRAQLDPAHAQRIIGITDDGDQGLIALQACQAYAQEVSGTKIKGTADAAGFEEDVCNALPVLIRKFILLCHLMLRPLIAADYRGVLIPKGFVQKFRASS